MRSREQRDRSELLPIDVNHNYLPCQALNDCDISELQADVPETDYRNIGSRAGFNSNHHMSSLLKRHFFKGIIDPFVEYNRFK